MSTIPVHQWTHDGKEVLLVKCVGVDGKSYGGFQWPQSGIVETPASRQPDCNSDGLFGWPWGVNLGGGIDPDYGGKWIVFSAPPENVILIDNEKAKVAPKEGETIARATVLFYGSWFEALRYCALGREAWIFYNSSGSAANSGNRGSAANSGYRGSAANSGILGASISTGEYSAASSPIMAYAGLYGRVRGKIGGALVLAFETKDKKYVAKAAIIDGKKIKPGVWYSLNEQGRFVVSKDQSKIFGEKDEEQKP